MIALRFDRLNSRTKINPYQLGMKTGGTLEQCGYHCVEKLPCLCREFNSNCSVRTSAVDCLSLIDTWSKFRLRMRIARQIWVAKIWQPLRWLRNVLPCGKINIDTVNSSSLTPFFIYLSSSMHATCSVNSWFIDYDTVYWLRYSWKQRQKCILIIVSYM